MRAIKFIDGAGNINYVKGTSMSVGGSLVKARIANKEYKGVVNTQFFNNHNDLYKYLQKNEDLMLVGRGSVSCGLKDGNSKDETVYNITL